MGLAVVLFAFILYPELGDSSLSITSYGGEPRTPAEGVQDPLTIVYVLAW